MVVKALQALNQHMQKCKVASAAVELVLYLLVCTAEQKCREMAELGVVAALVGLLSNSVKAIRSYASIGLSLMTPSGEFQHTHTHTPTFHWCLGHDVYSQLM